MSTIIRGSDNIDSNEIASKSYVANNTFGTFKNYIIDGRFDFWYEGTSQTSAGYGSDTMWNNGNIGSTKTHTRQAFATGSTFQDGTLCPMYYSRTVVSSVAGAGNYVTKVHIIEDVTRLAGKTVTLSFYVKADSNKNIALELKQTFGNGGSPSSIVTGIGAQKIALTTAWQKVTRTITIPSISDKTLGTDGVHTSSTQVQFFFEAGSNFNSRTDSLGQQSGTFDIAMVQLEEGNVATPYEDTDIGTMGMRVGRYYQQVRLAGYNNTASSVTLGGSITFPIILRGAPIMSLLSGVAVNYQNLNQFGTEYFSVVSAGGWNNGTHKVDARL